MDQAVYSELNKRRAALSAELKGVEYAIGIMKEEDALASLDRKGIRNSGTPITFNLLGLPAVHAFFEKLAWDPRTCKLWLTYRNKTAKGAPCKTKVDVAWWMIQSIDKARTN